MSARVSEGRQLAKEKRIANVRETTPSLYSSPAVKGSEVTRANARGARSEIDANRAAKLAGARRLANFIKAHRKLKLTSGNFIAFASLKPGQRRKKYAEYIRMTNIALSVYNKLIMRHAKVPSSAIVRNQDVTDLMTITKAIEILHDVQVSIATLVTRPFKLSRSVPQGIRDSNGRTEIAVNLTDYGVSMLNNMIATIDDPNLRSLFDGDDWKMSMTRTQANSIIPAIARYAAASYMGSMLRRVAAGAGAELDFLLGGAFKLNDAGNKPIFDDRVTPNARRASYMAIYGEIVNNYGWGMTDVEKVVGLLEQIADAGSSNSAYFYNYDLANGSYALRTLPVDVVATVGQTVEIMSSDGTQVISKKWKPASYEVNYSNKDNTIKYLIDKINKIKGSEQEKQRGVYETAYNDLLSGRQIDELSPEDRKLLLSYSARMQGNIQVIEKESQRISASQAVGADNVSKKSHSIVTSTLIKLISANDRIAGVGNINSNAAAELVVQVKNPLNNQSSWFIQHLLLSFYKWVKSSKNIYARQYLARLRQTGGR